MRPIEEVAEHLGLHSPDRVPRRSGVLKIPVATVRDRAGRGTPGHLILVTAMTPTPHGEGKTVTSIGLGMGLERIGRSATVCLRQPSLGPVFGIKGGAAGAGRATVEPGPAINLGLSGDIDGVGNAHNLLAALVDNHIFHGNPLELDPAKIRWPRALDVEDRALRRIRTGVDDTTGRSTRESSFVISAASEVMAILGLARDYADLKERLGRILVGARRDGRPARATDLQAAGAMTALLHDALEPNLVQTAEGTPALVHGGPFGNIAHGTASRLSIDLALHSADFTVVEVGFGSDLGLEKFVDLVAPTLGVPANGAVVVATARALRYHGGEGAAGAGDRLSALRAGLPNLEKHLENVVRLGLPAVVAVNRFPDDTPEEVDAIRAFGETRGVEVVVSDAYGSGGAGTEALASRVVEMANLRRESRPLYDATTPIREAVGRIVTTIYGGDGVEFSEDARSDLEELERWDEASGPVCVAKTALSLSDDPHRLGRPSGFTVKVDHLTRSAGAGFTVVHAGRISLMPGLPTNPSSAAIDVDADGTIRGVR